MSETPTTRRSPIIQALVLMGGLLALMWVLEAIDTVVPHNPLDAFGIPSLQLSGLPNILWAPLLHFGWPHLISNSVPFLVLGVLTYLSGPVRWVITTLISTLVSGLFAWLLSAVGTVTLGASGVIFGYLTYLLVRGIYTRKVSQILIAVVVFLIYGSVLFGVFPTAAGVSWQGHLGGAVGGVLAAWLLHGGDKRRGVDERY